MFRLIVTLREIYLANIECSRVFRGTHGETKNSSRDGSHNDVRRLRWPNLGCESPLAETPKGSLCWENLCGLGRLVGGALTGVTVCMYVCTCMYVCIMYVCVYVCVCVYRSMYHAWAKRAGGEPPPPLSGEWAATPPPHSGHPRPVVYIFL